MAYLLEFEFVASVSEHRIQMVKGTFCPRGTGNFSIRFYEAICLGRIPVILNTDIILPFAKYIPWNELCVISQASECMADDICNFAKKYDVIDVQKKLKEIYLTYFDSQKIAQYLFDDFINETSTY